MKKYIILLLAVVLVLGLASCKDKPAGNNEKDKAQVQTEPSLLDELQGKIKADGKLLGVAYLGWIEGDAETAKAELAKQDAFKLVIDSAKAKKPAAKRATKKKEAAEGEAEEAKPAKKPAAKKTTKKAAEKKEEAAEYPYSSNAP